MCMCRRARKHVYICSARPSGLIECDQLIGPRHAELPFGVQLKGEKSTQLYER